MSAAGSGSLGTASGYNDNGQGSGAGAGAGTGGGSNEDKYGTVQSRLRTASTAPAKTEARSQALEGHASMLSRTMTGPHTLGAGSIGPGTMQFGNTFSKRQFEVCMSVSVHACACTCVGALL